MLLAEGVKDDVDLIQHVHHLHGGDVDADLVELDHVAEQDCHVWEDLEIQTHNSKTSYTCMKDPD